MQGDARDVSWWAIEPMANEKSSRAIADGTMSGRQRLFPTFTPSHLVRVLQAWSEVPLDAHTQSVCRAGGGRLEFENRPMQYH